MAPVFIYHFDDGQFQISYSLSRILPERLPLVEIYEIREH